MSVKSHLIGVAIAAVMLAQGLVVQARPIVVRTPPPRARSTRVVGRPPHRGWVWTPGYYRWSSGRYAWTRGRWVAPPRRGARWVSPRWRRSPRGYTFVAGRWR
jgi:WXXGXW repeat (2 copies)